VKYVNDFFAKVEKSLLLISKKDERIEQGSAAGIEAAAGGEGG